MVGVAAGVAALGAGAYYLLGPKGKVNQKKAKDLFNQMKKEVAIEIKKAKEISKPYYHRAVDVVAENYAKQYKLHEKDIQALAQKLKGEWKEGNTKVKKAVRAVKRKVKNNTN